MRQCFVLPTDQTLTHAIGTCLCLFLRTLCIYHDVKCMLNVQSCGYIFTQGTLRCLSIDLWFRLWECSYDVQHVDTGKHSQHYWPGVSIDMHTYKAPQPTVFSPPLNDTALHENTTQPKPTHTNLVGEPLITTAQSTWHKGTDLLDTCQMIL